MPSRTTPFQTVEEIEEYFSGDEIECLECGQLLAALTGNHLRTHGLTAATYREKWGLPRRRGLAGLAYKAARREIINQMMAEKRLTHWHLEAAREAALGNRDRRKAPADAAAQSARVAARRPGDHSLLPPGAKRRDGRDAEKIRLYQREYRARKRAAKAAKQEKPT